MGSKNPIIDNSEVKINSLTYIPTLSHSSTFIPQYAEDGASGADLFACIEESLVIHPFQRLCIPTGIKVVIPKGFEIQIRPRSGLAAKNGITVLNSPGTIDSSYRGEIKVLLINLSDTAFIIEPEMKIAQAVCSSVIKMNFDLVTESEFKQHNSDRGDGGFGSTGNVAVK
jgi:dUTP pyrophosphatase